MIQGKIKILVILLFIYYIVCAFLENAINPWYDCDCGIITKLPFSLLFRYF